MSERIQPPKTLEDFKKIRQTTIELMANPYCDQFMFLSLNDKLTNIDLKIKELSTESQSDKKEDSHN